MEMNKPNTAASLYKDVSFTEAKPSVTILLETSSTKELRICLAKGVLMADHKSPFPIVIHIQEGSVALNIAGVMHDLEKGELIGLEGAIMHNLTANENSIIRLSIHKQDHIERVQNAINTN
jgi:quercetin dioxygenase-like cupin family protein